MKIGELKDVASVLRLLASRRSDSINRIRTMTDLLSRSDLYKAERKRLFRALEDEEKTSAAMVAFADYVSAESMARDINACVRSTARTLSFLKVWCPTPQSRTEFELANNDVRRAVRKMLESGASTKTARRFARWQTACAILRIGGAAVFSLIKKVTSIVPWPTKS